jgi:hypothetical protein
MRRLEILLVNARAYCPRPRSCAASTMAARPTRCTVTTSCCWARRRRDRGATERFDIEACCRSVAHPHPFSHLVLLAVG